MAETPPRVVPEDSPEPGWSLSSLYVAAGEPLGNVSYHVRQLEKVGLIELVAIKPRRGALEHECQDRSLSGCTKAAAIRS
jgi:hypothetical protein